MTITPLQPQAAVPARPDRTFDAAGALQHARSRDDIGHRIQIGLALLFLVLLPVASVPKEYPFGALVIWSLVRLKHTWPSYVPLLRSPLTLVILAWVLWHAVSWAWSSDWRQGWDEFGASRVLLLPLLLWPILDRVPWLIGAALLGVLLQNGAQVVQALGFDLRPQDVDGRYGGLIHPIKTGAWCAAAMCWHMSAVFHARGRLRWASVALLLVTSAGLLATEARGPWLSAAIAVPLMILTVALRRPAGRKTAALIALAAVAASLAAWPLAGERVRERIDAAAEEARSARQDGIYWTSVGLRIGMTHWAWDLFLEHPVVGLGAGEYKSAHRDHPDFKAVLARARTERHRDYMQRSHPHSMYLYSLASTGLVGGALLVGVIALVMRRCWLDAPNHVYADGTLFALISWLIGAQFDCYNLDGHRLGLFALIVAVTLPGRFAITPSAFSASPVNP
jgi:O-antigen ligase